LNDTEARSFLEEAFGKLFEPSSTEADVLEYFSPDYKQDLNGKVYGFKDFMQGVSGMKSQFLSLKADFKTVVSSGDTVAEVHVLDATRKDGTHMRLKILAFQKVKDGRICGVEELNCPL
jgi:ketosteroid isomerase-like protein